LKNIRWGIIGCGDVTEIKSGPGFQKADNSKLAAVMRRDEILAKDYAECHNVPRWYSNADKLINDSEVDAVYIATPPSTHKEYTLAAAGAGKPVYVEKPMALSYAECLEMVKTCDDANVPLYVAYYRRALPRFLKVKSILDDGKIGEIRFVNVKLYQRPSENDLNKVDQWRVDPKIAGCGYFCDLGSHMLDLLQYFLGKIVHAEGYSSNQGKLYEAEDIVSAIFQFESGVHGVGLWSFNSSFDLDETEIVGANGKVTYSNFGDAPIIVDIKGNIDEIYVPHPEHVQQPLIQLIVDDLLGKGESPSIGKTALTTAWVMDKILGRI